MKRAFAGEAGTGVRSGTTQPPQDDVALGVDRTVAQPAPTEARPISFVSLLIKGRKTARNAHI